MRRGELVGGHLSDEQLLEVYVDGSATSTGGGREHVEECDACRERYVRLTGALDTWRSSVVAEADAVFTESRLERQRFRILSRLVALTRGPRVVPFPTQARTFGPSPATAMRRWVVAAAAAGLLVGVALGRLSFVPSQTESAVARPVASPTMTAANSARQPADARTSRVESSDYLQFLDSQIDDLSDRSRSRISELQVIDQITPRAVTAVARLR